MDEMPRREPRSQLVAIASAEIRMKVHEMARERGLTSAEVLHILLHEAYHLQAGMM